MLFPARENQTISLLKLNFSNIASAFNMYNIHFLQSQHSAHIDKNIPLFVDQNNSHLDTRNCTLCIYNIYEPCNKFFKKLVAYLAILHLPWKGCFHWQSQEWENLTHYNIEHTMQKSSPTPEKLSSQEWKFWLSGVATLITGLFGLLGNGVSLVVLCRRWFYLLKKWPWGLYSSSGNESWVV